MVLRILITIRKEQRARCERMAIQGSITEAVSKKLGDDMELLESPALARLLLLLVAVVGTILGVSEQRKLIWWTA